MSGKSSHHTQDKDAERRFFDEIAERDGGFVTWLTVETREALRLLGLDRDLGGMRILEAGCASGEFGARLARNGARVIGVDLSPGMIGRNRELHGDIDGYDCLVGDLENDGLFPDNAFDAVVCFNVLHHFPDPSGVIASIARWLVPGGTVYCLEPNGGNPANRLSKVARGIVRRIRPELLISGKLSTLNEERDHSMADYERLFAAAGFANTFRASFAGRGALPRWYGFRPWTLISVARWSTGALGDRIMRDPLNRGDYLVFSMTLKD